MKQHQGTGSVLGTEVKAEWVGRGGPQGKLERTEAKDTLVWSRLCLQAFLSRNQCAWSVLVIRTPAERLAAGSPGRGESEDSSQPRPLWGAYRASFSKSPPFAPSSILYGTESCYAVTTCTWTFPNWFPTTWNEPLWASGRVLRPVCFVASWTEAHGPIGTAHGRNQPALRKAEISGGHQQQLQDKGPGTSRQGLEVT